MAVGADEDAFRRLLAKDGQRPAQAATSNRELLRARIEVVKLKCSKAAVVATAGAASARLSDEDLLDPAPPARDRVRRTARAPRRSVRAQNVRRVAVHGAGGCLAGGGGCSRALAPRERRRLKTVPLQPVAHGRRAATELRRDLADRQVASDAGGENATVQLSPRRVAPMDRPQPEPLHPVRHRRRMPANAPRDLLHRQALGQPLLELLPIHDANTSSPSGRKGAAQAIARSTARSSRDLSAAFCAARSATG